MGLALTTVQQHLQMLGIRGQAQGDDIDTGQDFDCTHRELLVLRRNNPPERLSMATHKPLGIVT
jgi:hypothetical protein